MSSEQVVVAGTDLTIGGVETLVAISCAGQTGRWEETIGISKGKVANRTGQHTFIDVVAAERE